MRRTDQRRAAVFSSYQHEVTGTPLVDLVERGPFAGAHNGTDESPVPSGPLTDFARDLVLGVEQHRGELDRLISEHAVDWSVDRIAPLERSILRTALYEILYRDDVPEEVAIDEAVETAKVFSGSEAPGFVNGILGGVVRELASSRGIPRGRA
jgi:transcription antitermination protein NusB